MKILYIALAYFFISFSPAFAAQKNLSIAPGCSVDMLTIDDIKNNVKHYVVYDSLSTTPVDAYNSLVCLTISELTTFVELVAAQGTNSHSEAIRRATLALMALDYSGRYLNDHDFSMLKTIVEASIDEVFNTDTLYISRGRFLEASTNHLLGNLNKSAILEALKDCKLSEMSRLSKKAAIDGVTLPNPCKSHNATKPKKPDDTNTDSNSNEREKKPGNYKFNQCLAAAAAAVPGGTHLCGITNSGLTVPGAGGMQNRVVGTDFCGSRVFKAMNYTDTEKNRNDDEGISKKLDDSINERNLAEEELDRLKRSSVVSKNRKKHWQSKVDKATKRLTEAEKNREKAMDKIDKTEQQGKPPTKADWAQLDKAEKEVKKAKDDKQLAEDQVEIEKRYAKRLKQMIRDQENKVQKARDEARKLKRRSGQPKPLCQEDDTECRNQCAPVNIEPVKSLFGTSHASHCVSGTEHNIPSEQGMPLRPHRADPPMVNVSDSALAIFNACMQDSGLHNGPDLGGEINNCHAMMCPAGASASNIDGSCSCGSNDWLPEFEDNQCDTLIQCSGIESEHCSCSSNRRPGYPVFPDQPTFYLDDSQSPIIIDLEFNHLQYLQ